MAEIEPNQHPTAAEAHAMDVMMYAHNSFPNLLHIFGEDSRQWLTIHEFGVRTFHRGDRQACGDLNQCNVCGFFALCRNQLHYNVNGCPTCDGPTHLY